MIPASLLTSCGIFNISAGTLVCLQLNRHDQSFLKHKNASREGSPHRNSFIKAATEIQKEATYSKRRIYTCAHTTALSLYSNTQLSNNKNTAKISAWLKQEDIPSSHPVPSHTAVSHILLGLLCNTETSSFFLWNAVSSHQWHFFPAILPPACSAPRHNKLLPSTELGSVLLFRRAITKHFLPC